jgi:interferon-induced GTP-binding protein Mx1
MEGAALESAHAKAVRPWLDLIDSLRALGVSQDLPLPQIAVMGDQSCGKSSVLEAISGVPFPRGSGLVTRCATQLTMKAGPPGSSWRAKAGVMNSKKEDQMLTTPEQLTAVISTLQDELTRGNKGAFSTDTISISVQAPGLPDLTLIDLPGIVRTHTAGQRESVVTEVNSLIEGFLLQERTIILAVVPANQDVATVDILERAKRVDPEGERTIGVLTKPDLINPGGEDEVLAVLKNIRKPLKLGYTVVKCRSQKDMNAGMDALEAVTAEMSFFRSSPAFSSVSPSLLGIGNLTQRLTDLLVARIRTALPSIKWELQNQLTLTEKELRPMLKGIPSDEVECHSRLMRVVSDYCRLLRQSARGLYRDEMLSSRPNLRLHAECQIVFRELHQQIVATVPGFNDPGFGDKLAEEMMSLKGRELPGFLNLQVFYGFMVKNVETWKPAVEACWTSTANAALSVSSLLIDTLALQFPKLCLTVRDVVSGLIEDLADEVSERIDDLFAKESDPFTANESMLEVINTIRYRNFDMALEEALAAAGDRPAGLGALHEAVTMALGNWYMTNHGVVGTVTNVEDMCTLLHAYWNVATKRLVDNVCMTIEQDFLVKLVHRAESELLLLSSHVESVEGLFTEDISVMEKRRSLQAKRDRLDKGLATLREHAPEVVAEKPRSKWEEDLDDDLRAASVETFPRKSSTNASSIDNAALLSAAEGRRRSLDWSHASAAHSKAQASVQLPVKAAQPQPDHYNLPVRPHQQPVPTTPPVPHQVLANRLVDMGFTPDQAVEALRRSGNDPDRAAEWLVTNYARRSPPNGLVPRKEQAQMRPQQPLEDSRNAPALSTIPVLVPAPAPAPSPRSQDNDFLGFNPPQASTVVMQQEPRRKTISQQSRRGSRLEQSRAKYSELFGDDES